MLKQLMISKKIEQRKASMAELLVQEEALKTRSAELEGAIDEAKTDEEIAVVDGEIAKLDADKADLDEKKGKLEGEIADLEGELEKLNSKEPVNNPEPENKERKKVESVMKRDYKFGRGITRDAIAPLIEREDVKEFLTRARELKGQKRAVTGAELNIPEVMLDLLRDNLNKYSKLISEINLKPVAGKARQNIMGTIPEGVWTEAVGKLNVLSLTFNQIEVDGYKVGGYIAIPNSTIEDSDLNLAAEMLDAIGQAIGYAVDKAILFGTGTKMPVGIATRLAQTSEPGYWGTYQPTWTDLHTSNVLKFDPTSMDGQAFFAALITKLAAAKPNYSDGRKFWCMNATTKANILAKALTFNAAGAIVAGLNGEMPVVGGKIIELDFISDNDIIGGYGSLYLLAERAGAQFASSDQFLFTDDQTCFKGTARYDGQPVIGEGFVAVNIANSTPTTSKSFATDSANF